MFIPVCVITILLTGIGGCAEDIEDIATTHGNRCELVFGIEDMGDWHQVGEKTRGGSEMEMLELDKHVEGFDSIGYIVKEGICAEDTLYYRPERMMTRGTPYSNITVSTIGMFCYVHNGNWTTSCKPNLMFNVDVTKSGNIWKNNNSYSYYWPGKNNKASFFAYYPKGATGLSVNSTASTAGAPRLTYTVPSSATAQTDLLAVAVKDVAGDKNATQALQFKHILTAVHFVVGSNGLAPCYIESIKFLNVYNRGTYTIGTGWSGQTYSNTTVHPELAITYITSSSAGKQIQGTANEVISTGTDTYTMMMIPQTLPTGAQLELTIYDDYRGRQVLTADISGKVWAENTTVEFVINPGDVNYVLGATSIPNFTHAGGSAAEQCTVASYKMVNGSPVALTWELVGYKEYNTLTDSYPSDWTTTTNSDGLHAPEWIRQFSNGTKDGTAATTTSFDVNIDGTTPVSGTGTITTHHSQALRDAATRSDFDLSHVNFDGTVASSAPAGAYNTANCYVIPAAGTYKIPLVYGNAIVKGKTNRAAYHTDNNEYVKSYLYCLQDFKDYKDAAISDPYIYNKYTPASACLVWSDISGSGQAALVKNVSLSADKKYLTFSTIDKSNMREGNAIVAVKDSEGKIMWSWHLWFTAENVWETKRLVNAKYYNYDVMKHYLGWCYNSETTSYSEYPRRTVQLLLRMYDTNGTNVVKEHIITIQQDGGSDDTALGNCTYYQWGRKDPMLPLSGSGNVSKGEASGSDYTFDYKTSKATIGETIQNPNIMYTSGSDWITNTDDGGEVAYYTNLWDIGFNTYIPNGDPYYYGADAEAVKAKNGGTLPDGMVEKDGKVVNTLGGCYMIKSIYDPCPIGFHISPLDAFSAFTITGIRATNKKYFNVAGDWVNADGNGGGGFNFYCEPNHTGETIFLMAIGARGFAPGGYGTSVVYYRAHMPRWADGIGQISQNDLNPWDTSNRNWGYPIVPTTDVEGLYFFNHN